MPESETYAVEIAGLKRELRLFEIKPGLKIAILNILGDTELVQACAKELAQKLKDTQYDVLVTAEAMVAEMPKKEAPAPAMPGGGGMGGMGF